MLSHQEQIVNTNQPTQPKQTKSKAKAKAKAKAKQNQNQSQNQTPNSNQPTNTQQTIPCRTIHFEMFIVLQVLNKFPPLYGIRSTFTNTLNFSPSGAR